MAKIKRTICPNCGASYDALLSRCPHCHRPNDDRPPSRMMFLPIPFQISFFLIGLLGINLLAVIYTLIFQQATAGDSVYRALVVNSITYVTLFVADICVGMKYYYEFLKPFSKGRTYIAGLIGGALLIGSSILIGLIMHAIVPTAGTGENQSVAVQMVLKNPVVCIFVLGIMGPFVEECAYRVGLFSLCKRASTILAYIATMVVFTIIHLNFFSGNIVNELVALPDYLFAAGIFCVLYHREGFGASFIAHCLNNLYSVIMIIMTNGQ